MKKKLRYGIQKSTKTQAGMNSLLLTPPPPSQNSHAVDGTEPLNQNGESLK